MKPLQSVTKIFGADGKEITPDEFEALKAKIADSAKKLEGGEKSVEKKDEKDEKEDDDEKEKKEKEDKESDSDDDSDDDS